MTSNSQQLVSCQNCGGVIHASERHCPGCLADQTLYLGIEVCLEPEEEEDLCQC